ncbi:MAG: NAD(P)H-dependent oxidoreductase [Thermodesulfobacteriota bacterium]|nr:NAD(P)H-dependent oxidoreductase [Thermodesulfobacteriota bacterium]
MLVLGLNGSPRKKGNSDYLLSLFLKDAEKRGFETKIINGAELEYKSCTGCGHCEKKGFCIIEDSLAEDIFPFFRRADVIVLSTPVYFYSVPAQIKHLIDRTQTLWSRKYRFGLKDPGSCSRKGIFLSCGATKGDNLFDGIRLTAKYFFDALGAEFADELCYRRIDSRSQMEKEPGVRGDVRELGERVLTSFETRKRVLFICRENAGRSQMAAGFAKSIAGENFDVMSAGSRPAEHVNQVAVDVMAEKGLDLGFIKPCSIDDAIKNALPPNIVVTMGCGEECPVIPGAKVVDWDLPDPAGKSVDEVRTIRDIIEKKVISLCS